MSVRRPVRETRDVLVQRAKEAMRLAENEPMHNRARIHIQAAERWLVLAERKGKLMSADWPPRPRAQAG
jgi:predicted mannosyl-3-phosphoglycerate phosphatase (HAD superfamily)